MLDVKAVRFNLRAARIAVTVNFANFTFTLFIVQSKGNDSLVQIVRLLCATHSRSLPVHVHTRDKQHVARELRVCSCGIKGLARARAHIQTDGERRDKRARLRELERERFNP